VRLLIITTALLLCIQILLGAFTVWKLLASWSVTSHLLTGNTIAASMLIISRELSEIAKPQSHRKHVARPLRTAILVAAGLLVLQMGLGGWVSSAYAGLACPDWPTCLGGEWFPTFSGIQGIHVFHRLNAYALLIVLVACAGLSRGLPVLGTLCALAGVLVAAQVAVGVGNVLLRIPIELTGLHSALAALLVAVLSLAVRELWYSPR
jgi:cytochrome c oxidase assembly protein subunit 15